ncbi:MAG: DUF512 domain-containing protein [Clostridia bacterium]|nr:DUF512 domain-containing protein [Clostridia bacterium]
MALRIASIQAGGWAARAGLRAGDVLECINGEPVLDQVDYQYLSSDSALRIGYRRDGQQAKCALQKPEGAPLGLELESGLMSNPRRCANRCLFCFVDQLPGGMRPSLYIKDDDWRLSLMAGNYITLTNLPGRELQRLIDRKANPLYLSVHATDAALRARMLGNPHAGHILASMRRLAEAGIAFHCQVVLCPGLNDGDALENTLADLYALRPAARSVALVPVGLTKHRQGLATLEPYTAERAAKALAQAGRWQERALRESGSRFVFPADELYQIAGVDPPPYEAYEDFCQIENGVGLLARFERELQEAARLAPGTDGGAKARRVAVATGVSAADWLRGLIAGQPLPGVEVTVHPIVNRFFGETVTVAGLVTGGDLLAQLAGLQADELLIPASMLRAGEPVFLDGVPLSKIQEELGVPVRAVPPDGGELLHAILGVRD